MAGEDDPKSGAGALVDTTPPKKTSATAAATTDDIVDAWFNEIIRGGPIARDVSSWNAIQEAAAILKARLKGE